MKFSRAAAAITAFSILLTGCGSLAGRPKIESGFSYIESHEYKNALESFDAAEENGEDTCLLSRGRGIAHYHLAEYEEAVSALLLSLASDDGIVDEMDFDTNYYLADSYIISQEPRRQCLVYIELQFKLLFLSSLTYGMNKIVDQLCSIKLCRNKTHPSVLYLRKVQD